MKNLIIMFLAFCALSCVEKNAVSKECQKIQTQDYYLANVDTTLLRQVNEYHQILLDTFSDNSIKETNLEGYHLLFYSSHGYGKSIKFTKANSQYNLVMKCVGNREWKDDCKQYIINIEEDEWNELEKMIYEFDFWTSDHFRANRMVLDGYAFFLEGNRPYAESCNLATNKLISRGSPRYDKIGDLCQNIIEYEGQLRFRYEQYNKIK